MFSVYMSALASHISISVPPIVQLLRVVLNSHTLTCLLNTCSGTTKSWEFVLAQVQQPNKVTPLNGTTPGKIISHHKLPSFLIQESAIFMYQELRSMIFFIVYLKTRITILTQLEWFKLTVLKHLCMKTFIWWSGVCGSKSQLPIIFLTIQVLVFLLLFR